MATSIEKLKMDLRSDSTVGDCYDETENCKPESDGPSVRKLMGRKDRILYDREFLIKCFHSPASTRKPNGFPIPHLDCTLAASKVKRLPLTAPQATAYPVKRKEELSKRDRDTDEISLRPHSGNFPSGGFGPPHPSSPSHSSSNTTAFSRILPHEDSLKGFDRDFHRNNFRFGNHRRDPGDRNRMDRDRDMDRDFRGDRMNRDRLSGSNHRNSNSWSDAPDNSDWPRRRNGAHFPRDRDYNTNRRYSNDRGKDFDEQEPEWFSGGPSSQHETIELRGFMDDDRRDKSEELPNGSSEKENSEPSGENDSSGESTKNDNARDSPMDLSIEKILKIDHIPGFLSNDLLESVEPSGSSRFSQFFQRNSTTPDFSGGKGGRIDLAENMYATNEDKSKAVHEMGELLRNMLIKKKADPSEPPPPQPQEPRVVPQPAKATAATKDDVDAFKKMMTPLLEKVLQGPAPGAPRPIQPPVKPGTQEEAQQGNNLARGGNVLDIFKQSPSQKGQPQKPDDPSTKNNPLQDIFNNMMSKSPTMQDVVPQMTANQILQMIPYELHHLLLSISVTQWDYIQLANIAKSNEWTFRHVLDTFITRQCPPHQHMVFAGILHLILHRKLTVPGVVVTEVPTPMNHAVAAQHQPPPPMNHRPQNFEGPKEITKRSSTPVSSMAFTPTSVMRKMTADGTKSGPPQPPPNHAGFIPVPISGGLLPTPPNAAPVMMNSNNPNLATLMSSMGRAPPMHISYRPPHPAMGYAPNPGFHPNMMPPNIHGPMMVPHQFQNILPTQPVYKPEDN